MAKTKMKIGCDLNSLFLYGHTQMILQKGKSEGFWIYKAKNVVNIDHNCSIHNIVLVLDKKTIKN